MKGHRAVTLPGLPRFTGGAVGYLGYGAASWFEPVLGDLGQGVDGADDAGFMVFDTVLAFDHVQHRILIIANARIAPGDEVIFSEHAFLVYKIATQANSAVPVMSSATWMRGKARPAAASPISPSASMSTRSNT